MSVDMTTAQDLDTVALAVKLSSSKVAKKNFDRFCGFLGVDSEGIRTLLLFGVITAYTAYHDALVQWCGENGSAANIGVIVEVLEKMGWEDLREKITICEEPGKKDGFVHFCCGTHFPKALIATGTCLGGGSELFQPEGTLDYKAAPYPKNPRRVRWFPGPKQVEDDFLERSVHGIPLVDKLHSLLTTASKKVVITQDEDTVSPFLGGTGKSTLALWYANNFASSFYNIIWLDCGVDSLQNSIDSFCNIVGTDKPEEQLHLPEKAEHIFNVLGCAPSLFIYDNAEDNLGSAGIESVLPCEEAFPNIWCIITSNSSKWDRPQGKAPITQFPLRPFSKDDAIYFFEKNLRGVKYRTEELVQLAENLNCLPLPLKIVITHLNNYHTNRQNGVREFLETLKNVGLPSAGVEEHAKTIFQVLYVTISKIKAGPLGELAMVMLSGAAFLRPNYIGVRFLSCVEGIEPTLALKACKVLAAHSLITLTELQTTATINIFPKDSNYISIDRSLQSCVKVIIGANKTLKHIMRVLDTITAIPEDMLYKLNPFLEARLHPSAPQINPNVKEEIFNTIQKHSILKHCTFAGNLGQLYQYLEGAMTTESQRLDSGNSNRRCEDSFSREYSLKQLLGCGTFGIVFSAVGPLGISAMKYLHLCPDITYNSLHQEYTKLSKHENHQLNLVRILGHWNVHRRDLDMSVGALVGNPLLHTKHRERRNLCVHKVNISSSVNPIIRCIEMELCGPSLRGWLNNTHEIHPIASSHVDNFDMAINIANDVIRGLKFLHSRSIVHRNLKPENIYFSVASTGFSCPIKIGDSGQAPLTESTPDDSCGLYRAPEALATEEECLEEADWFSFGLILYEMIYQIPFSKLWPSFYGLVDFGKIELHPLSKGIHSMRVHRVNDIIKGLSKKEPIDRKETISRLAKFATFHRFIALAAGVTKRNGLLQDDFDHVDGYSADSVYELKEYIGCGGFGMVFAVKSSQRAIKVFASSADWRQNAMLRGCEVMSRFGNQHPNLVEMWGHRIIKKTIVSEIRNFRARTPEDRYWYFHRNKMENSAVQIRCIEMELCGPSLGCWLSLPVPRDLDHIGMYKASIDIASDIINGLRFLHKQEILHRNLKPENIYFSRSSEQFAFPMKIGDYGQFGQVERNNACNPQRYASMLYAASEVQLPATFGKETQYTKNSDWFSFGLILYQIFYLTPAMHLEDSFTKLVMAQTICDSGRFLNTKIFKEKLIHIEQIVLGLTFEDPVKRSDMVTLLSGLYNVKKYLLFGKDNTSAIRIPKNHVEVKYKLLEYLGLGCFGVMFSAEVADRRIAIELFPDGEPSIGDISEMFFCSNNHHTNLVNRLKQTIVDNTYVGAQVQELLRKPKETSDDPNLYYYSDKTGKPSGIVRCIEMELFGPSLRNWLTMDVNEPTLDFLSHLDMATIIATDIIKGLQFLHSKNLPHRNLNPDNIFFSVLSSFHRFSPPVKIGNLGQCHDIESSRTGTGTTELYRAVGSKDPSWSIEKIKQADWYSVGLILYDLFYIVRDSERKRLFYDLVTENKLKGLPMSPNAPRNQMKVRMSTIEQIVLGLTRRTHEQRAEMVNLISGLKDVQMFLMSGRDSSRYGK